MFRLATYLRRTKAAIKIQKVVRMWLCRKKYLHLQATVLVLQRYYRGYKARKFTLELRRNNAVSNYFSISQLYYVFLLTTLFLILKNLIIGCAYSIYCSNVVMLSSLS